MTVSNSMVSSSKLGMVTNCSPHGLFMGNEGRESGDISAGGDGGREKMVRPTRKGSMPRGWSFSQNHQSVWRRVIVRVRGEILIVSVRRAFGTAIEKERSDVEN